MNKNDEKFYSSVNGNQKYNSSDFEINGKNIIKNSNFLFRIEDPSSFVLIKWKNFDLSPFNSQPWKNGKGKSLFSVF